MLLLAVVGLWALTRTYPNYDSYYHLVWGREILDGLRPSFEAYSAPTEHPLWIALCAVLGLAGEDADRLLVLVCLLAHAALIFGTYRLGADVFGRWSGLLAAAFVGASASFLLYAARGYVDSAFLAVVVWAAAFEAARPGRFALSGGLLALAGLLRPEAWVLAGLYAVWGWRRATPRERAILAGAVVLPPLIWGLVDASVTGDPLHSLHATTELADELGREQGIGARARIVRVVHRRDRAPAGRRAGARRRRDRLVAPGPAARCACRSRCSPRAWRRSSAPASSGSRSSRAT